MEVRELLNVLHIAERLKDELRHCPGTVKVPGGHLNRSASSRGVFDHMIERSITGRGRLADRFAMRKPAFRAGLPGGSIADFKIWAFPETDSGRCCTRSASSAARILAAVLRRSADAKKTSVSSS